MDTTTVAKYFPIENQQQIYDFLDESDGCFDRRVQAFFEYLFLVRAETPKQFGEALQLHLFTKEYIKTHHWLTML